MFGTREFASLFHNQNGITEETIKDLLEMSKKLSQVIAFIWLDKSNPTAGKLHQYFTDNKVNDLLFADTPGDPAFDLLSEVFSCKENFLPIFKRSDIIYWDTKVIYNSFEGFVSDIDRNKGIIVFNIPYPPRPIITDDRSSDTTAPLSMEELAEWIEEPFNQAPYASPNPYIPTTCT
jgi:hypothetical protein